GRRHGREVVWVGGGGEGAWRDKETLHLVDGDRRKRLYRFLQRFALRPHVGPKERLADNLHGERVHFGVDRQLGERFPGGEALARTPDHHLGILRESLRRQGGLHQAVLTLPELSFAQQ